MTASDLTALRAQLIEHEGLRLSFYTDSVGIPTIGVGRNLRDTGISHQEAMELLDHDIQECLTDLGMFPWFLTLDPVRQRALCDLRFNLGQAGLRGFPKLLAACAAHDWLAAAFELTSSKWATQVQPTRRDRLVQMLKEGIAP